MGETRYLQGPDILMRRRSLLFLLLTLLRPMGLDGQSVTVSDVLFLLGLYGTPCE